jgi:hypothetical protein
MFFKNDDFRERSFISYLHSTVVILVIYFCIAAIASFTITSIEEKTFEVKETYVYAQVINMKHVAKSSSLVPVRIGKSTTYVRRTSPEKFLVTVSYGNITETFDSATLYQAVENGAEIQLTLVQKFHKETGEIRKAWLKLAE